MKSHIKSETWIPLSRNICTNLYILGDDVTAQLPSLSHDIVTVIGVRSAWSSMAHGYIAYSTMANVYKSAFMLHYCDVIMNAMSPQITSLSIVYSTVYSDADQRKHQSSASLAFVRGIHRGPVNSPHKGPVIRKIFPFDDVTCNKAFPRLKSMLVVYSEFQNWSIYLDPRPSALFKLPSYWCVHASTLLSLSR